MSTLRLASEGTKQASEGTKQESWKKKKKELMHRLK